jgi:anti-sigma B factor antagonist
VYPISTAVEHRDGVTVLAVGGDIDMVGASILESAIVAALAEDPAGLVIDLSEVSYLASAGVRILVEIGEALGESVAFAAATQDSITAKIIRILSLDEVLVLHETLDEAVTAAQTRPRARRSDPNQTAADS